MVAIGDKPHLYDFITMFSGKIDFVPVEVERVENLNHQICKNKGNMILCFSTDAVKKIENKYTLLHGRDYLRALDFSHMLDDEGPLLGRKKNSELFELIFNSEHGVFSPCNHPTYNAEITKEGYLYPCCSALFSECIGKVEHNTLYHEWHSTRNRLINLSVNNGTLAFCSEEKCYYKQRSEQLKFQYKPMFMSDGPVNLNIAIDESCNYCCRSCRTQRINTKHSLQLQDKQFGEFIEDSYWNLVPNIFIAGDGEAFYSKLYREMLTRKRWNNEKFSGLHTILTNGSLYNDSFVDDVLKKFPKINMMISIDAATKSTYERLRKGGQFENLCSKLEQIKAARMSGKIGRLVFRFVVQIDNYTEMDAFVKFGKKYAADMVDFTRLVRSDSIGNEEYEKMSLLDSKGKIKPKYIEWFSNPIFYNGYVNIDPAFRIVGERHNE